MTIIKKSILVIYSISLMTIFLIVYTSFRFAKHSITYITQNLDHVPVNQLKSLRFLEACAMSVMLICNNYYTWLPKNEEILEHLMYFDL